MNGNSTIRDEFDRVQRIAVTSGAIGLVLCAAFGIRNGTQFFRSYLFAYVFWLAIPMGCMAILMLHHLTGGWWGYPIRRLLEAGTRTFVWMAALFLPVLLGMSRLYKWAQPAEVAADPMLQYKHPYLNPPFFTVRVVIYFAIWVGLARILNKWSSEQDRTDDARLATRLEALSGPGLILWGIAVTYSSIDWVMSLEAHWFSTIYGMIVMVVAALTAMSFVVFVLRKLSAQELISRAVTPSQFNDLGNLMLAFVMLWAYLSFSQFLIIWSGNIKDEIPWYKARAFGGWGAVAVVLIVLHFALPFLLLLQRGVKRRLQMLSFVAGMLMVLSVIDVYWLVAPAYETSGPRPSPLDLFAVVGIGGLWLAAFFSELKKWPLLPQHDPRFEGVLEHEHGA
ncbi:MAG TPA: hypothetical protein VEX69_04115 [Candidatus Limnocylindria bacterium]|nr:hypothetical protein [Candidatus Limnocylindria bacterium]